MNPKRAFTNGGSTAARLPAESGIKPGDPIHVTVVAPGKVVIELGAESPEYTHFVARRSKDGGMVTDELVAKLLDEAGL